MGTNYWKSKVLPKIKKVFEKNPNKKLAAEACKTFDDSKEQYAKEFEDKKTELQPKVSEIYEASSVEIKSLVKERKDSNLKKHSAHVQSFLDELVKIEFPGSKPVSEACSKFGAAYVSGPVFFVLEKVSTFVAVTTEEEDEKKEEKSDKKEEEEAAAAEEAKEKEIVVAEEKAAEVVVAPVEENKKEEPTSTEKTDPDAPPAAAAEPATTTTTEPPKTEAPPPAHPPKA